MQKKERAKFFENLADSCWECFTMMKAQEFEKEQAFELTKLYAKEAIHFSIAKDFYNLKEEFQTETALKTMGALSEIFRVIGEKAVVNQPGQSR